MKQADLFEEPRRTESGNDVFPALLSEINALPGLADIFELSVDAYYAVVYAVMSELPIGGEISRFIQKAGNAADRTAAARAAFDRGDPDVLAVLKAAAKVQHEIHRITGFLRFAPGPGGVYAARCAPDYCILPALAEHFTPRFGETPWLIIDEKRGLCLSRGKDGETRLGPASQTPFVSISAGIPVPTAETGDFWEDLWRLYHRSVNNESRRNPGLQRRFIPERYRRYLTEMDSVVR